jgi:hypothetical protein
MANRTSNNHPHVDGLTIIRRDYYWHLARNFGQAIRKTLNAVHPFDLSDIDAVEHFKNAMDTYCRDPKGGHWADGFTVVSAQHNGTTLYGVMPASDYRIHTTSWVLTGGSAVSYFGMYRVKVVARFHDISRCQWTDGTMKTHPVSPDAGPGYELILEKYYSPACRMEVMRLWVPESEALSTWEGEREAA